MKITKSQLKQIIKEELTRVISENTIKTSGPFTTIHRDDGKIVVASKDVYGHIGTHGDVGKGSMFSGGITPDILNSFLITANIPSEGGGIPANFPGGGYLLVAPFSSAMKLQGAEVKQGSKENFDPKAGKMVSVPVAEVHTSQPISDFQTDETTVLVFPYNPSRSSQEQNDFIDSNPELSEAKAAGNLYAMPTAFPGGFKVEGQTVPRVTEWGGMDNPKWAVIIPDSENSSGKLSATDTSNPGLENYSKDAIDAATYALKRVSKWATGAMIESEIHDYLESLSSSGKELDIWKIADEALSVAGVMNGVGPNEY